MSPDNFQQAWQASTSHVRMTVDADLLSKEVQRNESQFAATILLRDLREVVVALIMIPVWIFLGVMLSLLWTWYLCIPGLIFVAAYMIVDRRRHGRPRPEADGPLREHVKYSLGQVEHQIWLLRNVFWWYIMPVALPCMIFFVHVAWRKRAVGWDSVLFTLVSTAVFCSVMGFVYWLNQKAVRNSLEPRQQELKELLSNLSDETDT